MNAPFKILCRLSLVACLVVVCACRVSERRAGELRTETQNVKRVSAKSVSMDVEMSAGELRIAGGAADLLEARFDYNVPSWKPRVNYTESGDHGRLLVEQPGASGTHPGRTENRWDLRLNNDLPMELTVAMGAGDSRLTLGSLALRRLDFKLGAGQTVVDLTGAKENLSARLEGGAGSATVRLPDDVGVRVEASGGLGSISAPGFRHEGGAYVNDAYGKSPVTLQVTVRGGVGEIRLELAGGRPTV
jgi:hypothetical protein